MSAVGQTPLQRRGRDDAKLSQQPTFLPSLWTEASANRDGLRDQNDSDTVFRGE